MAQYIDKDALVVEIERRRNDYINSFMTEQVYMLNNVLDFLNTLEVKEINLEDSIKDNLAQKYIDYTCKRHNIDPSSREGQLIYYAYMHGMNQCLNQLKAQKGE